MGKITKLKEQILKESEAEILLKEYLHKMGLFMGEEITIFSLSSERDIVKSLSNFTSKFDKFEHNELAFILLRSALLSNDNNYYNQVIKNNIANGELQDSLYLVNENMGFRKSLTRTLMNHSTKTDKELFDNLKDNERTLRDLDTLLFYESIIKEKEKELKRLNK